MNYLRTNWRSTHQTASPVDVQWQRAAHWIHCCRYCSWQQLLPCSYGNGDPAPEGGYGVRPRFSAAGAVSGPNRRRWLPMVSGPSVVPRSEPITMA